MLIEAELVLLPFASLEGKSLLHRLVTELSSGKWTRFYGAIGFAKNSGNFPDLLDALEEFATEADNELSITFGADIFGGKTRGSDYQAIRELVEKLDPLPSAELHLYHEKGKTFHPKLYLFADELNSRALLIVGSSNWSEGGLVSNIEADVILHYDLNDAEHRTSYEEVVRHFDEHWREVTNA